MTVAEIHRLNSEVIALHDSGHFQQAIPIARRAVALSRMEPGEYQSVLAASLCNLAGVLTELGTFNEAGDLYNEALDIYLPLQSIAPREVANAINSFGKLAEEMGEYGSAATLYQRAVALLSHHLDANDPENAVPVNNLGMAYQFLGDYRGAEEMLSRALRLREDAVKPNPRLVSRSLTNLAELYRVTRRYKEARPLYARALAAQDGVSPSDEDALAATLNGLGILERASGQDELAVVHLGRALDIWIRRRGAEDPKAISALSNLALAHARMGHAESALEGLTRALVSRRRRLGNRHPDTAISLYNLGLFRLQQGSSAQAFDLLSEAAAIDDAMLAQVVSSGSERQVLDHLASISSRVDAYLSLVCLHLSNRPTVVSGAFSLVLRRKAISVEALHGQRALASLSSNPKVQVRRDELNSLSNRLAQTSLAGPEAGYGGYTSLLRQLERERDRMQGDLARLVPELNFAGRLRTTSWRAIARGLPQKSVLIEFVRFGLIRNRTRTGHYVAFILRAGSHPSAHWVDLGDADRVDRLISDFRSVITGEGASASDGSTQAGGRLSAVVFLPLLQFLRGRTRVIIAPDGELTRIPFEALPLGRSRIIDKYHVSYLGCGRDVLRGPLRRVKLSPSLVVADPDFDLGSDQHARRKGSGAVRRSGAWRRADPFPPLPGTRVEAREIAGLLRVGARMGARALEGLVKATKSPAVVHFATHGFFFPDQEPRDDEDLIDGRYARLEAGQSENPLLRSGVALAGANSWNRGIRLPDAAEDGILTAEDVSALQLGGTELVVLSACETGLGSVRFGAGVLGLRRAFAVAGARTLIFSLWKVPDGQTRQLMAGFYKRLLAGMSRSESLREAQLELSRLEPDPYYWAAFICEGEPGQLPAALFEASSAARDTT